MDNLCNRGNGMPLSTSKIREQSSRLTEI